MFKTPRFIKEFKRKQKLGDRYTSSITDRKFRTNAFIELNPQIDLQKIEFIYSLGYYKRTDFWITIIEKCLKARMFNTINNFVARMDEAEDAMGYTPIGNYVQIFVWKNLDNQVYGQLVGGEFNLKDTHKKDFIINTFKLKTIRPNYITNRELIYPI